MNTNQILKIIGAEKSKTIITGHYGDASLHDNNYVVGDPCYFLRSPEYQELCRAASEQQPAAYGGTVREWVEIQYKGQIAFFLTCSDGNGPLCHCVDSGWIAAIPFELIDKQSQDKLNMAIIGIHCSAI